MYFFTWLHRLHLLITVSTWVVCFLWPMVPALLRFPDSQTEAASLQCARMSINRPGRPRLRVEDHRWWELGPKSSLHSGDPAISKTEEGRLNQKHIQVHVGGFLRRLWGCASWIRHQGSRSDVLRHHCSQKVNNSGAGDDQVMKLRITTNKNSNFYLLYTHNCAALIYAQ